MTIYSLESLETQVDSAFNMETLHVGDFVVFQQKVYIIEDIKAPLGFNTYGIRGVEDGDYTRVSRLVIDRVEAQEITLNEDILQYLKY